MATPKSFGLVQIGQIAMRVHDLDRAIAFFRDTLGMRFLFEVPKMSEIPKSDVKEPGG